MQAKSAERFEDRIERLLAAGVGYILTDRSNIYHHETLREAAVQYKGLRDRGLAPALTRCKDGKLLKWDVVRAWSPWRVIDATDKVIADSEDGLRSDDVSRLAHALNRAAQPFLSKDPPHAAQWPLDEEPTAVNLWTGERLQYSEAWKVAARGHRG